MMYWLLPRLSRFQEANPDVPLRFNMASGTIDFTRDNVGVAIRLASIEPPRDALCLDICTEWTWPVCTPEHRRSRRIRKTADLRHACLMHSRTRPQAWTDWRQCYDTRLDELSVEEGFAHFYLRLQAARCGLGVSNVPRMLVHDGRTGGAAGFRAPTQ